MVEKQNVSMIRIFIGSSTQMLPYAYAVKRKILDCNQRNASRYNPVVWDELSIFRAGMYTLESLEEVARICTFACLIYGPDDRLKKDASVVIERDGAEAICHVPQFVPRDNVIFETGFFMGLLTRNRTFVLKPSFEVQTKVLSDTSDIRGVTYCKFTYFEKNDNLSDDCLDSAVLDACNRICKAIDATFQLPEPMEKSVEDEGVIVQGLTENISNTEFNSEILETTLDMPVDIPKSSRKGDIFPESIFRRRK